MMKRAIIIGVILMLLTGATAGCQRAEGDVSRQLHTADSLMDLRPDSALTILSHIKSHSLRGELRPWHALLFNKAMLKNHRADTTDTLINIAVDHYSGRGDSLDYQSVYYQGVIYNSINSPGKSLVALHEAHEKATAAGNLFYQAMSARELSTAYYGLDNVAKELEWAEKAKQLFTKAKKPLHAAWMDIDIADALTYNHRPAEALEVIANVDESLLGEDSLFRSKILKSKATAQHMADDYAGTAATYTQLLEEGTDIGPNHKFRFASALMHLGRDDEAMRLIEDAEHYRMHEPDSLYRLSLLADIYAKKGNMAAAYELRTEYARKLGLSDEKKLIVSPTDLLTDTYRLRIDNQNLRLKYNRLLTYGVMLGALLLVVLLCVYFSRRLYVQRLEKEKSLAELSTLHEDLKFKSQTLSLSQERYEQLEAQRNILREDLEKSRQTLSDSQDKYRALEAEKDSLQSLVQLRENEFRKELKSLFSRQVDMLDDVYGMWFRNSDTLPGNKVYKDTLSTIRRLSDSKTVEDLAELIDRYNDNWMSRFKSVYIDLSRNDYLLSLYLYIGFRAESIAVLMDKKTTQAVHTAKHKLKVKLLKNTHHVELDILSHLHMNDSMR
ncbi:MAG: hypothetical protein HDR77_08705 [Bacteroides sp.]|nr:hypothetical protein [Bacteroides sp.]